MYIKFFIAYSFYIFSFLTLNKESVLKQYNNITFTYKVQQIHSDISKQIWRFPSSKKLRFLQRFQKI